MTLNELQTQLRFCIQQFCGQPLKGDFTERNHRFLESALLLVKLLGYSESEAVDLVKLIYSMPTPEQGTNEIFETLLTFIALVETLDVNLTEVAKTGLTPLLKQAKAMQFSN